ncbi:MAG: hypothetical protein ACX939_06140 [Hyphococcus sp.]
MTPVVLKAIAAIAAVAGLAATSADDLEQSAGYPDSAVKSLTRADIGDHAALVFARADRNRDGALNVDEYAALSVVTAELAHLNGFIAIERKEDAPAIARLPSADQAALSSIQQTRIAAVARSRFYVFAGEDGAMNSDEFSRAQMSVFDEADFNRNGVLVRNELAAFAEKQVFQTVGA